MNEETIQTIIQECLEKLCIEVERIEPITIAGHTLFNVTTPHAGFLLDQQGETLRALNTVVRRLVEKKIPEYDQRHFLIDINNVHKNHIIELQQKAQLLAERVRTFKTSAEMSPMNAYDRMIVHATFTEDPDVVTESEGDGKMRRVVLKYRHATFE